MVLTLLGDDRYWLTEIIQYKLTKTNCIGILFDLVYVLVFLGEGGGGGGVGAMEMRMELKGLTWCVG